MNDKTNIDSLRILLVEDNPTDALLLEVALQQVRSVKITLTLVKRLDEALLRLQAEYFDAVLLDLGLPDSSGLETFTRTQSHYPSVPILVLSGLDDETLALTAVRDGAQDYLVKGKINSIMLARTIRYAIERKRTAERLTASEMGYRRLFETAQDGIFILDFETGQVTDANPFLENLLGYSTAEFIGKRLWEISPFRTQEANKVAFRTLQEKGFIHYDDLPLATKDGRLIDVEFVSNVYSVGDKQVIQCSIRDISERKRAEMALQQNETKFRTIFETAIDAILLANDDGNYIDANPAACALLGLEHQQLMGHSTADFVSPSTQDAIRAAWHEFLREGQQSGVFEFRQLDGTERQAEFRAVAGLLPGVHMSVLRDITERKLSEATLLQSEARFRMAISEAPVPIMIHREDGKVLQISKGWTKFSGYDLEDIPTIHDWVERAYDSSAQAQQNIEELYQIAEARDGGEWTVKAKNGEERIWEFRPTPLGTFDDGGHVVISVALDITERKEAEAALQKANDELESRVQSRTAELERANAETRTQARQQEAVAELGQRALTGCDMDTLLTGATTLVAVTLEVEVSTIFELLPDNEALCIRANTGFGPEAAGWRVALGNGSQAGYSLLSEAPVIVTHLPTETRFEPSTRLLDQGIVSGLTVIIPSYKQPFGTLGAHTIRQRHFTQDDVHFLQSVANVLAAALEQRSVHEQLRLENEERQVALSALQEATAGLKEAKEEAERFRESADAANLAKSEFLSRMSHELRTPLNAILGFGQILEMQDLTPRSSESVGYILKGGRHLLDLINEVLDIARVEAGHTDLSLEPIDLADVVPDVCALVRPLAAERNIRFDTRLDQSTSGMGHSYILADLQRLKQVFINLLSNAIKYNRENGQVEIFWEQKREGWISIAVRDTGPGISPQDISKLFTPFERLSASTSTIEGTGLGLVLSQRLVTAMGGTLTAQSTLGQGTTFTLELPQATPSEEQVMNVPQDIRHVSTDKKVELTYCVLCIEDNLANLRLIEALFEDRPEITLLAAMQGSVGLDLARQHEPDLILLDLDLPDIRGSEVLTRLQQSALTRDIPIVVVSADATPHQIERLLTAGAKAYLTKPLDVGQFLDTIDTFLEASAKATSATAIQLKNPKKRSENKTG